MYVYKYIKQIHIHTYQRLIYIFSLSKEIIIIAVTIKAGLLRNYFGLDGISSLPAILNDY